MRDDQKIVVVWFVIGFLIFAFSLFLIIISNSAGQNSGGEISDYMVAQSGGGTANDGTYIPAFVCSNPNCPGKDSSFTRIETTKNGYYCGYCGTFIRRHARID